MAVSVLETIKSRANAANTAYIVVVKLLCDDYSDLPAQSGLSGYELAQGCTAHVISENKDYMIDSSGNWHVYGGDSWTNVYTKSETDALLDDKQDELTTAQLAAVNSGITAAKLTADEAALVELVDNGAKNLLWFDETSTDNNNVRFTVNADGSITATQIAARTATAIFRMRYRDNLLSQDVRGKILSGCPSGGGDNTYKINIERRTSPYTNYGRDIGNGLLIPNTIADNIPLYLYIQVYSTATLPLTFKPMICTKAAGAVSQKFVPYRPSWQEMYEMILALQ